MDDQMTEDEPFSFAGLETVEKPRTDPALEKGFADLFGKFTAAEVAEHERWIAQKKREATEGEIAKKVKEWEEAVPPNLRETDFNDFRLLAYREQINAVLDWKHTPKGIYAIGKSGRGKSRSMYALARRLARANVPLAYILQGDVTREINRQGLASFFEKIDRIKRAPVIVWDDFGKFAAIGSRKDLLSAEIEALIDFRFSEGLPMLISSNATSVDLMEMFGKLRGEPILRRLVEGSKTVSFGWE